MPSAAASRASWTKKVIDERRALYTRADGGFNADAFAADLSSARSKVALSLAIFPGSLNLVFLVGFFKADGVSAALDAYELFLQQASANLALWSGM